MFWNCLKDTNPKLSLLQDKLRLRYMPSVARNPEIEVPRILWSVNNWRDIPSDGMHAGTVIKSNNSCGRVRMYPDRAPTLSEAQSLASRWLWLPHFPPWEFAYHSISPRVFCEEMVKNAQELQVFVEEGRATRVQLRDAREGDREKRRMFRLPWKAESGRFSWFTTDPLSESTAPPKHLAVCIRASEAIAADGPGPCPSVLRVDFYVSDCLQKPILGEVSVYPGGGLVDDSPP